MGQQGLRVTGAVLSTGSRVAYAGFTYLAVIVALFVLTSVILVTSEVWVTTARREAERELLFVGQEIRCAIGSYYERGPGVVKRYPVSLDELLSDRRFLKPMRHLRRMYLDPVSRSDNWVLLRAPEGGVMGVASPSPRMPLKQAGFGESFSGFENAGSYERWQFTYRHEKVDVTKSCFGPGYDR